VLPPTPPTAPTCRDLVERATDYLEGTLPPLLRARLDAHLAGCPDCRTYLDQMRRTVAALGALSGEPAPPAPAETRRRLLRRFRDARRRDG
jgi:anti-sigma factor RsiW